MPIPWRCTSGSTASISISPVRSFAWRRTATYPTGLELVEQDYEADVAADFEFGSE